MDKREIDTLYSVPPALVDGKFSLGTRCKWIFRQPYIGGHTLALHSNVCKPIAK